MVEVGPVELAAGPGEVALVVQTRPFDDVERPEDTGPASTSTTVIPFEL